MTSSLIHYEFHKFRYYLQQVSQQVSIEFHKFRSPCLTYALFLFPLRCFIIFSLFLWSLWPLSLLILLECGLVSLAFACFSSCCTCYLHVSFSLSGVRCFFYPWFRMLWGLVFCFHRWYDYQDREANLNRWADFFLRRKWGNAEHLIKRSVKVNIPWRAKESDIQWTTRLPNYGILWARDFNHGECLELPTDGYGLGLPQTAPGKKKVT